jgi:hypothetical protein
MCAHHVSPRSERIVHNVSQACDALPGRIDVFYHEASYGRSPRRTQRSHGCQRASRKLSVHAAALCSPCAHHALHYNTAQALRARGKRAVVLPQAFGLPAIVAGWTWCAISTASAAAASTATTSMHSPTHRRLRQALRRQRCTARPLFTRPAWPRRTLRSHDFQRA